MTAVALENLPVNASSTAPLSLNGERYVAYAPNGTVTTQQEVLLLARVNANGDLEPSYDHAGVGTICTGRTFFRDTCAELISSAVAEYRLAAAAYWRVAKVSPEPQNGCYYRTIGVNFSTLVQYWDADHASRRNSPENPWNIMYGAVSPWFNDGDSYPDAYMQANYYVQVELTESSMFAGKATAESEVTDIGRLAEGPEPVPTPDVVATPAPVGPEAALGLVKLDENGNVPDLNGALGDGVLRIAWWTRVGANEAGKAFLCDSIYSNRLEPIATVVRGADGNYSMENYVGRTLRDDEVSWLPAVMPEISRPEPVDVTTRTAELSVRLNFAVNRFQQFNEDLNDLAKDKEWCSDYESTIVPYGMEPRVDEDKDYTVDVRADVTLTINSPSSEVDEALSREAGISIESTNLSTDASIRVSVDVTTNDPDAVYDQVDTQMVKDAIESMLGSNYSVSVDDYECMYYEEQ